MKKLDHGIIGAYILYSELVENYLKKYEESGADARKVRKNICFFIDR